MPFDEILDLVHRWHGGSITPAGARERAACVGDGERPFDYRPTLLRLQAQQAPDRMLCEYCPQKAGHEGVARTNRVYYLDLKALVLD